MRTALLFFCLLGLAASAAVASPLHGPMRTRIRSGNFVPVYKTYRYHSHQDRPLFSFLHFGSRHPAVAKHRSHSSRRHTTGLF